MEYYSSNNFSEFNEHLSLLTNTTKLFIPVEVYGVYNVHLYYWININSVALQNEIE